MSNLTFSGQVKQEICSRELRNPCCISAACYGVACFGKYFDTRGIVLHTEQKFIAQWAKSLFALANIKGQVFVRGGGNNPMYEFAVKDPFEVDKMLAAFGHTGEEPALRINLNNFECDSCFSAFVAAAFLCCGTMVSPQKSYNLEFVVGRFGLAQDLETLLTQKKFMPKRTVRKGINIVYFKSSEQIEDMLTYMGATKGALEIMNQKVYRDFRNKANRITNCETANIDKTLDAARRFFEDVDVLQKAGMLALLEEPLQAAIKVRQQHPEFSLTELAALLEEPVSKSGLSHRYRKIAAKAEALRHKQLQPPAKARKD
ncbi:DNA-binding protein WhiA [Ruminococcaceae bacterium OttesenSCG-928-A16]|nr:DNA-binding protein WhiA [Ruminococcaceae bacterium OttesenSCG-928-A16]